MLAGVKSDVLSRSLRAGPRRVRALWDLAPSSRSDNSGTPQILKIKNSESRWQAARKGPKLYVLRQDSRAGVAAHAADPPQLGRQRPFDVSDVIFRSDESTTETHTKSQHIMLIRFEIAAAKVSRKHALLEPLRPACPRDSHFSGC